MIRYTEYEDIFALEIERLRRAIRRAREVGVPENYDYVLRLFIQAVLKRAREIERHEPEHTYERREIYKIDPDVYLPKAADYNGEDYL